MQQTAGSFFKTLFNKGQALASVYSRKGAVKRIEQQLNSTAHSIYSGQFLGDAYNAPITAVAAAFESFLRNSSVNWTLIHSLVDPTGDSAHYQYAAAFTEVFTLPYTGLTPKSIVARAKVGMMAHEGETETVYVPYEFRLTASFRESGSQVRASLTLDECIDPINQVPYLVTGHFSAPTLVHLRMAGISADALRSYLHGSLLEDRPTIQDWFASHETQALPQIAALQAQLRAAGKELAEAESNLAAITK